MLAGRKHQLRIHCAQALGCPILGDQVHGRARASALQKQLRQLAHACQTMTSPQSTGPGNQQCHHHSSQQAASPDNQDGENCLKQAREPAEKFQASGDLHGNDSMRETSSKHSDSSRKHRNRADLVGRTKVSRSGKAVRAQLQGGITDLMLHARTLRITKPGQVRILQAPHSMQPVVLSMMDYMCNRRNWAALNLCRSTMRHSLPGWGCYGLREISQNKIPRLPRECLKFKHMQTGATD